MPDTRTPVDLEGWMPSPPSTAHPIGATLGELQSKTKKVSISKGEGIKRAGPYPERAMYVPRKRRAALSSQTDEDYELYSGHSASVKSNNESKMRGGFGSYGGPVRRVAPHHEDSWDDDWVESFSPAEDRPSERLRAIRGGFGSHAPGFRWSRDPIPTSVTATKAPTSRSAPKRNVIEGDLRQNANKHGYTGSLLTAYDKAYASTGPPSKPPTTSPIARRELDMFRASIDSIPDLEEATRNHRHSTQLPTEVTSVLDDLLVHAQEGELWRHHYVDTVDKVNDLLEQRAIFEGGQARGASPGIVAKMAKLEADLAAEKAKAIKMESGKNEAETALRAMKARNVVHEQEKKEWTKEKGELKADTAQCVKERGLLGDRNVNLDKKVRAEQGLKDAAIAKLVAVEKTSGEALEKLRMEAKNLGEAAKKAQQQRDEDHRKCLSRASSDVETLKRTLAAYRAGLKK